MAIPALLTKLGGIQTNHVNSKEHICTRHGSGKSPTNEGFVKGTSLISGSIFQPAMFDDTGGYDVETSIFHG